jgi:ubiquinone/menaquinone biosynthesis C-methylase UbiE
MTPEGTLPLRTYSAPGAGTAFDRIAQDYDRIFTDSIIGRAQRDAVWAVLTRTFKRHDNILELNCGTGEDAIFLAGNDISVFASDASEKMIARAEQRLRSASPQLPATFCELSIERIGELHPETPFDGAFSNFSGLNCVADLDAVASSLAVLVRQGGRLVLCFSTRFCLAEFLYFVALGQWGKAVRRWKGHAKVQFEDTEFTVYYPTIRRIHQAFARYFRPCGCTGIGLTVPPSYLERWAVRHSGLFRLLHSLERPLATLPILRGIGDHVLLCFERVSR